ncbi:MAG: UDP binding domain-containing protein, partial [Thermoproteota archaeon]
RRHVVDRVLQALKEAGKNPAHSTVVVWGLSYKGEVRDTRRSPALDILRLLRRTRLSLRVYDPFVPKVTVEGRTYESARSMTESVSGTDCVLITTNHNQFHQAPLRTLRRLMRPNPVLFDTRNTLSRKDCEKAGFTYLSTGRP